MDQGSLTENDRRQGFSIDTPWESREEERDPAPALAVLGVLVLWRLDLQASSR